MIIRSINLETVMRGDQPPAGERQAGGGVCGEVECRKIFPDQRPYEPEVLCTHLRDAGKNAGRSIFII